MSKGFLTCAAFALGGALNGAVIGEFITYFSVWKSPIGNKIVTFLPKHPEKDWNTLFGITIAAKNNIPADYTPLFSVVPQYISYKKLMIGMVSAFAIAGAIQGYGHFRRNDDRGDNPRNWAATRVQLKTTKHKSRMDPHARFS